MQYLCFKRVGTPPLVLSRRRSRRVEGRSRRRKRGRELDPPSRRAVGAPRMRMGLIFSRNAYGARNGSTGRPERPHQEAVYLATQALLKEVGRGEINVPMIAERAGVTPSTVYRRWGDLAQLLADTAAERFAPWRTRTIPARLPATCAPSSCNMRRKWPLPSAGRCCATCWPRQTTTSPPRAVAPTRPIICKPSTAALSSAARPVFGRRSDRHPDRADLLPILFANGETSPDYVNALLARFARLNEGSA